MSTRFSSSARSGVSPVTLVLFILLTVTAGIIAFVMYTKKEKVSIALEKEVATRKAINQRVDAGTAARSALVKYLPRDSEGREIDDAEKMREYFKTAPNSQKLGFKDAEANFRTVSDSLGAWVRRLDGVKKDLEVRVVEATNSAAIQETARQTAIADFGRRVQALNAELRTMDADLKAGAEKRTELITQYGKETRAFVDRYDIARNEHDTEKARLIREADGKARRNEVIRRDLRVLRPEPSIRPPVAHVVRSDERSSKAVVDVGERQHVFPGLVLEVYTFNRDGQRVVKGKLNIMQVSADSSICNVTEMDTKNPILAGDPVQTQFMPVRPGQRFVIAGFIPPDAPFDEAKLKALIQLNGGVVQENVGLTTDTLILGETATAGLGEMAKRAAETTPEKTRRGLSQADVARELSIDIVDYEDFTQGLLN